MPTLLQPVLILLALPCLAALWMWRLPGRFLNPLRACVYAAAVIALAEPALLLRRGGGTVIVVADRSASLPPGAAGRQLALIQTVQARRRAEDRIGVVSFATRAAVEHQPQTSAFGGFLTAHDPDASNLSDALQAAFSLIPPGAAGRVLVLSDGRFTGRDPQEAAGVAAARGVAIDYRLQTRGGAGDTAVARVDAPQEIRAGEALLVTAWVDSPVEQEVSFALRRGATVIAQGTRRLPRGLSPLVLRDLPEAGGGTVRGYAVTVDGDTPDPIPENNTARFLLRVAGGKPLACVVAGPGSRLPELLAAGGIEVEVRAPETLGDGLESLAGYSGVVIENTRADRLGTGALQMIEAWVRHAGGGLLLTGGRNAFGVGGYYRSALEPALPVTMELRREHRKFSMAIVVALDRSGSMSAPVPGGKTKMDLANLGTVEVLNMLSGQDEMGVIAVDSLAHVVVNRAPVDTVRGDERRILGIQSMGGGIFIYEALKAAARELNGSAAGVRHILLFADAADSEEPGNYKELIATAAAAGITVSVVGLGTPADSDAALLKDIAERGGGRCFFTDNAQEVPRLFAQDTFMVARNTWVTNAVAPRFTVALPQLSDALPSEAPPVGGYNLCYLKPEATAVAVTRDENEAPLVALRRHGTGRAAVFTGEADGADAGPFARWPAAGEFYGALARYCAGPRQEGVEGLLAVQTPISGGIRITVYADTRRSDLRGLNDVAVETLRHQPGLPPRSERLPLPWRTADTMAIDIPLTGGETLLSTVAYPDGRTESLPPVCLPYSPEHAPAAGADGAAVLAALAEATGGTQLADVGSVWEAIPRGRRHVPLAPFFYLLAALLFLFEVFERRTGWLDSRLRRRVTPPPAAASDAQLQTPSEPATVGRVPEFSTPATTRASEPAPVPSEESPLARAKRRARERIG